MLLDIDKQFKLVFQLSEEHKKNFYLVKETQELTLDKSRPFMGLKGTFGLYGSEEWWNSIKNGRIKSYIITGKICRLYEAGQDNEGEINSFTLISDSKKLWDEGIYLNNSNDISLFKIGKRVKILYILNELKSGGYLESVLEMVVEI